MSQEASFSILPLDPSLQDAAHQAASIAGGDTTSNSSSQTVGPTRKRAPLASVACQDCRRRKTKCDGNKPACGNCAKRGVSRCIYDLEPNQSRVAAYKQKIEQQMSTIKALEDEIHRLKTTPFRPGDSFWTSASESTRSTHSPSGGVPLQALLNPAPGGFDPTSSGMSSIGHGPPPPDPAPPPPIPMSKREIELLGRQEIIEAENRMLRELIIVLNRIDDRTMAKSMTEEIDIHGISDLLLARAQHQLALQVQIRP